VVEAADTVDGLEVVLGAPTEDSVLGVVGSSVVSGEYRCDFIVWTFTNFN
jgi:hypothetical protein